MVREDRDTMLKETNAGRSVELRLVLEGRVGKMIGESRETHLRKNRNA